MKLVATSGRPRPRLLVCLDAQQANVPAGDDPTARNVQGRLANCRRILDHARKWDWNIVHVYHRRGPDGAQSPPIEGLEPRPSEPVISREGVSAFSSRFFRQLVDGAHDAQIILIGFSLASSCLATLFAAYDRGLATLVIDDAVLATPLAALAADKIESVVNSIAAPFTEMASTDQLIGERQAPRLVVV